MSNQSNTEPQKMLEDILFAFAKRVEAMPRGKTYGVEKETQAIAQAIEQIIGEDEQIDDRDSDWYLIETSHRMGGVKPYHLKTTRNEHRALQREAAATFLNQPSQPTKGGTQL
jgi:hypothetical protein